MTYMKFSTTTEGEIRDSSKECDAGNIDKFYTKFWGENKYTNWFFLAHLNAD